MNAARLRTMAFVAACAIAGPGMSQAQDVAPVAIRNAPIVPISGPVLESGTIVLSKGLIRAVGARVDVPAEAVIIDGSGLTVYPGLIDALTDIGLAPSASAGSPGGAPPAGGQPRTPPRQIRGPQDRPASTPWLQAADEFKPDERRLETWRNGGFTTAVVAPKAGILPGQAAVINLGGEGLQHSVVRGAVALPINMTAPGGFRSFPGALMGVISYVRQVFLDTRHYDGLSTQYESHPRGRTRPDHDRTVQALQDVLDAKVPVLLPAVTEVQIDRMIAFGRELDVPFVLYGAHQGYAAAGRIAKARVPVLMSAKWPERAKDADPDADESLRVLELRDKAPGTPAALAAQKVPFAFYSDGLAAPGEMLANVRKAVSAGLSADAALRALTLDAAQIYGVQDRLGSLETGKIANLVVVQGDLLGEKSTVKHVFVDGRRFDIPPPDTPARSGPPPTDGRGSSAALPEGDRR